MTNTNTAAIESLLVFAARNNEIEFCHLANAALDGEEWAADRLNATIQAISRAMTPGLEYRDIRALQLAAIRATDTSRPDGLIARTLEAV